MKELTIKEKAKAYDKALERAINLHKDAIDMGENIRAKQCEVIFPELAMSEENKIRKDLIEWFDDFPVITWRGHYKKDIIAWLAMQDKQEETLCDRCKKALPSHSCQDITALGRCALEKQTEQNPNDNLKPEFKVGDWITFYGGEAFKIIKIEEEINGVLDYLLVNKNGHESYYNKKYVDENARLWTIEDAKDGDVLVSRSPFIYGKQCPYGGLNWCNNKFIKASNFIFTDSPVHPAAKEQRDFLFQKMKEAGYTFDFKNKELKKIKNDIEIPFGAKDSELQEATYYIPKGFHAEIDDDKVVIKKGEKPAAWSEEDEKRIANILSVLSVQVCWDGATGEIMNPYQKEIDWLKSLKDRVQSKQEWSEDDKKMLESIIYDFGKGRQSTTSQDNWLKSLAPWSIPKIRFV